MDNTYTPEQILAMAEKIRTANEDDTPFAVVNNDTVSVIGDANKTQVVRNDYKMRFRMPKEWYSSSSEDKNIQEVGSFIVFDRFYEGVTITPRSDLQIISAMMKLQPFFMKVKEDNNGSLEYSDNMELIHVMAHASTDIVLAMYNVVATFLGIDDITGEWMLPGNVIETLSKIFTAHPEMLNEADVFFGFSTGEL